MFNRFPTILKPFGHTSAAFREASVADGTVVEQDLASCLLDGLLHDRIALSGDSLVALAVVVGTDIKQGMVFAVVPTDQLLLILLAAGIRLVRLRQLLVFLDLGQEPAAGDDRMCF